MVTFVCDDCQTSLKKAKVQSHGCRSRMFSCVDCNGSFTKDGVAKHNACRSEAEQVEGKLYKGPKFVQTTDAYGNRIDPNKSKGDKKRSDDKDTNNDNVKVGSKRKEMDSAETKSESSKKQKTDAGAEPAWSDLAKAVMSQLEKKSLMLSKLKKKLKKSGAWDGDETELGKAILELNAYATLSKTVVSADDED